MTSRPTINQTIILPSILIYVALFVSITMNNGDFIMPLGMFAKLKCRNNLANIRPNTKTFFPLPSHTRMRTYTLVEKLRSFYRSGSKTIIYYSLLDFVSLPIETHILSRSVLFATQI